MQTDNVTVEILKLLEKIDMQAASVYNSFALKEQDQNLKDYWNQMSEEEKDHVKAWRFLADLAVKGEMSQIFDYQNETKSLLDSLLPIISNLINESKEVVDISRKFKIACDFELIMLNSAFINAFYILQTIKNDSNYIDCYEKHLTGFIDKLNEYGSISNLSSLVHIIKSLWSDNKKLITLTNEDYLTRILNRRGFIRTALPLSHIAHRNHHTVAVMMLDLDHFKKLNDTYGHIKGDEALAETASIIKSSIRRSDLAGRYGGEEFIIFLPQVEESGVLLVAEKIRKKVEETNQRKIPLTISIGVAFKKFVSDVEGDFSLLIREADKELYKAKTMGRNRASVVNLSHI